MRPAGIVIWRQIADVLAEEIADGTLAPGARLPTEASLARRFGVNRHTLRRALASLEAAGSVSVQHGRGSFVRSPPALDYKLGARTRFSEIVAGQSRQPEGELLTVHESAATEAVAAALDLPVGAAVTVLEILRRVDGMPLSLSTTFLDAARFAGIDAAFRNTGTLTAALARFGVADYVRRATRIWTRLPSAEEALLLRQDCGTPVLVMESVDAELEGRPLRFSLARAAGERLQLVVAGQ